MNSFDYYLNTFGEIGFVEYVTKDVVGVSGLPSVKPEEMVMFETGQLGQALFLHPEMAEVLLFDERAVKNGTKIARTGKRLSIPVGKELLGYLIDPLCCPINHQTGFSRPKEERFLKIDPPGIEKRISVSRTMETGVGLVDLLLPLGYGQRELIIGDRKTGKTSFLLQTVLNQAKKGTICIWAAIGKKTGEIKQVQEFFKSHQVMDKIVIIASSAGGVTGLIYLAPYSAITLAEYFKDAGLNSLVILDDLSIHAKFYRELSLLSKRFPGRESYPVDVFFTHAAILERGGNFCGPKKTVSISILPVAETNEGDLSGYIQTNVMSMTDGHLFFDRELFSKGRRPAINPFLSVTRVGRQTQTPLCRQVSRELMSFLVNFQKLSSFVHFGAELTDEVKNILAKGERIMDFFNQGFSESIPLNMAILIIGCLWLDFWKEEKAADLKKIFDKIISDYETDQKFRQKIDKMIGKAENFEKLLKKIRKTQSTKVKSQN